ncbi:MAG: saccharopine dehydrogenase family protein [Calditrichia bacterium]
MNILVLGAGLVGAAIVEDLAVDFDVTCLDINQENLDKIKDNKKITKINADVLKDNIVNMLLDEADVVVNATPGFMGFQVLKKIIEAGKNCVDIAFFSEDPFELDELARSNGVTAIVDCGVAPGMSNILTGYVYYQMERTDEAVTYVGGLPKVREWPWEYKAVFSPIDVIEEYTRPARYIRDGKMIVMPALSEPELMNFPGVGTIEAFNTDGLRTMAQTLNIPNMKEKTLRYPGHIEKMRIMRETGLFSTEPVEIKGVEVRPIDLTAKLLFPQWELKENETDITVMRVEVTGLKDGKKYRYIYDLIDEKDDETGVHSMARTTGYTATAAVRLLAEGLFGAKGIIAPEFLGKNKDNVKFLLKELKKRNIEYVETIEEIE